MQFCFSPCIALIQILWWGKQRKTLTDLCKIWETFTPSWGDDYSDYQRLHCPIGCSLQSHSSMCLANACGARWVPTAAMLIVTTVHTKLPHVFCTAQSLIRSRKFPTRVSFSGLSCLWEMHTKNCKCVKWLISSPVAMLAWERFYLYMNFECWIKLQNHLDTVQVCTVTALCLSYSSNITCHKQSCWQNVDSAIDACIASVFSKENIKPKSSGSALWNKQDN